MLIYQQKINIDIGFLNKKNKSKHVIIKGILIVLKNGFKIKV